MTPSEHNSPQSDKTFYFEHNGEMVRVRAPKKPSNKTVEALKAMVEAVQKRNQPKP